MQGIAGRIRFDDPRRGIVPACRSTFKHSLVFPQYLEKYTLGILCLPAGVARGLFDFGKDLPNCSK